MIEWKNKEMNGEAGAEAHYDDVYLRVSQYGPGDSTAGKWFWLVTAGEVSSSGIVETLEEAFKITESLAMGGSAAVRGHEAARIMAQIDKLMSDLALLIADQNSAEAYMPGYQAGYAAARRDVAQALGLVLPVEVRQ